MQCQIVNHLKSPDLERYANMLAEKRKHKGMSVDDAREMLEDANYYGCLMAMYGDADGMVSGSTSSTANTIRPALQVKDFSLSMQYKYTCHISGLIITKSEGAIDQP